MPLKTSQLNSQRAELDWQYMGEIVHVTYNPQGYTPALERRIQESMEGEYKAEALVFMLKTMLLDWDLVKDGEDGKEVPFGVEDDALMALPVKFLGDAIAAITDDIQALTKGNSSPDTSPPTA